MKILVVHNEYRIRGGEESVVEGEVAALRARGHDVSEYRVTNDDASAGISGAANAVWSRTHARMLSAKINALQPDIVHFHNVYYVLSPAVMRAAAAASSRPACVWTLHNYRISCANGLMLRDGHSCMDCLPTRNDWPGIKHRCFHNSRGRSALVTATTVLHRSIRTFQRMHRVIALTNFQRDIAIKAGLSPDRVHVKPNGMRDPGSPPVGDRSGVLFVGRLAGEKGVIDLVEAVRALGDSAPPVTIVGNGPLEGAVRAAARDTRIDIVGRLPREEVAQRMRAAQALVMPSRFFEGFPMTVVEAFAAGTPVIAANHGSLGEIVEDGETGLHVPVGDSSALARAIERASNNSELMMRMGEAARQRFEARFTEVITTDALESIYEEARAEAAKS